jgi:flagellar motor switch protein FliG
MGVYTRYKRNPGGFRQLVELLEATPKSRREKMIEVGMKEDPTYTQRAMQYMMSFEDVINLPDMELCEVVCKAPPQITAYAISKLEETTRDRFVKCAQVKPQVMAAIRDYLGQTVSVHQIGGAQMKLVATARELERVGLVRTKKIPVNGIE